MAVFQMLGKIRCTFRTVGGILNVKSHKIYNDGSSFSRNSHNLVGFVGLGNMGGPMALNLLSKGHQLIVFDLNPESMATLADQGALLAKHPADVASRAEMIITMLPSNKHVLSVYTGADGIFE